MPGEGRQALGDGLAVADVAVNAVPQADDAALAAGQVKAALGHQAEQPHGFDGHCFAACVGAGNGHAGHVRLHHEGEGHAGLPVQQGVPGLIQRDAPRAVDVHRARVHLLAQLGPGEERVQLGHHPHAPAKLRCGLRHPVGQGVEHTALLLVNGKGCVLQLLPQGRDAGGLHEHGAALGRGVHRRAAKGALPLPLHGQHIAPRAGGDIAVRKILFPALQDMVQFFADCRFQIFTLAAQIPQTVAGLVQHMILPHAALDVPAQFVQPGQLHAVGRHARALACAGGKIAVHAAAADQKAHDPGQLAGGEHAAHDGLLQGFGQTVHHGQGRRACAVQHPAGGGGGLHAADANALVRAGLQVGQLVPRGLGHGKSLQHGDDAGKFQRGMILIHFSSLLMMVMRHEEGWDKRHGSAGTKKARPNRPRETGVNAGPVIGTEQKRTGKQAVMPPPWSSPMPLQYRQHPRLRVFIGCRQYSTPGRCRQAKKERPAMEALPAESIT